MGEARGKVFIHNVDPLASELTEDMRKNQEIKVCCTYHPSYLLRNPKSKEYVLDDLKWFIKEMKI
jgi:uracil-DNA glycosylase family 4